MAEKLAATPALSGSARRALPGNRIVSVVFMAARSRLPEANAQREGGALNGGSHDTFSASERRLWAMT